MQFYSGTVVLSISHSVHFRFPIFRNNEKVTRSLALYTYPVNSARGLGTVEVEVTPQEYDLFNN